MISEPRRSVAGDAALATGPADERADDIAPRRQHPAWIFLSALRQLRGLALPLAVLLVTGGGRGDRVFLVVTLVLIVAGLLWRGLAWMRFRYSVEGGVFRVQSGLLSRRERLVPIERIQAVDTSESLLQRVFGVVRLRVETAAGGDEADVVLDAVSRAEAERLRRRLAVRESAPRGTPDADGRAATPADEAGVLLRRVTGRELLVAGATSGRIAPALAVLSFGFQFLNDLVPEELWRGLVGSLSRPTVRGLATVLVVAALFAWLLAIGGTLLACGGFELRRLGDRLLVAHGLLERRRRSIPLHRIQAVTLAENPLRQPFGLAALGFESAGDGGHRRRGEQAAEGGVLFPLLRRDEAMPLLVEAAPAFAVAFDPAALERPPARARGRYLTRGIWPPLALAVAAVALAWLAPIVDWRWGLLPLALVPPAVVGGALAFRDTGCRLDAEGRLVVRNGGWTRRTAVVPKGRVQQRSLRQNPLQRRAGLATVGVAIAAGGRGKGIRVRHLDAEAAAALLDRLGP